MHPVRLSSLYRPPVRLPFARPPQSARPPPVRPIRPCPPRPPFQKITHELVLLESFLPFVCHINSPHLQFMVREGTIVASG